MIRIESKKSEPRQVRFLLTRERRIAGFSIIESVMAIAIVSTMFAVAMNLAGGSRTSVTLLADRAKGERLAESLMNEILDQPYYNPAEASVIGTDTAEAATGNRSLFDDVDDYQGWTASPPEQSDGAVIPGHIGWTRRVEVEWVKPSDLTAVSVSESGIKRITVTVFKGDKDLAHLTAYRTDAWPGVDGDQHPGIE